MKNRYFIAFLLVFITTLTYGQSNLFSQESDLKHIIAVGAGNKFKEISKISEITLNNL